MRFSEQEIERIRRAANLADLVGRYSDRVIRSGSGWMARCPFHDDKNPSMSLDVERGLYNCFGCGEKGNIFNFIMKMEGLVFPEAVKRVAELSGGRATADEKGPPRPRPHVDSGKASEVFKRFADPKEFSIDAWMPSHERLMASETAKSEFFVRGILPETLKTHLIGYVEIGRDIGARPGGVYEDFWDKPWIGFPYIYDDKVRLVKWRPIFSAGKTFLRPRGMADCLYVYGEPDPMDDVFLVEGEPDALTLWQAGFRAASIPSGVNSKIDKEVVDYLTGFRVIYLCLDNDDKGLACAQRFLNALPAEQVRIVTIPEKYKDANGFFVAACGRDVEVFVSEFGKLVEKADKPTPEGIVSLEEAFNRYIEKMESEDGNAQKFFELPWRAADRMANILPGHVISLVSSRSGMGKSTWMTQVAIHNAQHRGRRIAYYTAEMDMVDEMVPMIVSQVTLRDRNNLERVDIEDAKTRCSGMEFYFGCDPDVVKWQDAANLIREAVKQLGVDVVIVDHLDYIIREADPRIDSQQKAMAMRWFKKFAVKNGVLVIILRQPVKPEQSKRRRGKEIADIYDIQGSGQAIADSNHIFILHRNKIVDLEEVEGKDTYEDQTKLILGKTRHKGPGASLVELFFNRPLARFERPIKKEDYEDFGPPPDPPKESKPYKED